VLLCCMCHEWKPETDFAFRSIKTGKRQSHCRKCHAAYRREHYLKNREAYVARESARMSSYRIENRALIRAYLSAHPCVDCGETDIVLLEFDHIDPKTKTAEVALLLAGRRWKRVLEEIEKCVVRCVACHRRRTAAQFNWQTTVLLPPVPAPRSPAIAEGTRVCTGCLRELPMSEFGIKNKVTGRRNRRCRACVAAASRAHYYRNRDAYLARNRRAKKTRSKKQNLRLLYLSTHPCVDCGESDPVLLDFDHRDGSTKIAPVARLIWERRWDLVWDEIAKCDVRCVRCHRRKTARDFGWSKLAETSTMYVFAGVA
jgi:hypothetical protein